MSAIELTQSCDEYYFSLYVKILYFMLLLRNWEYFSSQISYKITSKQSFIYQIIDTGFNCLIEFCNEGL